MWQNLQLFRGRLHILAVVLLTITIHSSAVGASDHHNPTLPYMMASIASEYAQLLASNFQYEAAITLLDTAIQLDANNAEFYIVRGQMIMLIYEWDRAIADYNTAIAIDPDYAVAYFHRGVAYYSIAERIDRQAALADFEQYLALDPDGELATQAQSYATSLQFEIEALGG